MPLFKLFIFCFNTIFTMLNMNIEHLPSIPQTKNHILSINNIFKLAWPTTNYLIFFFINIHLYKYYILLMVWYLKPFKTLFPERFKYNPSTSFIYNTWNVIDKNLPITFYPHSQNIHENYHPFLYCHLCIQFNLHHFSLQQHYSSELFCHKNYYIIYGIGIQKRIQDTKTKYVIWRVTHTHSLAHSSQCVLLNIEEHKYPPTNDPWNKI